MPFWLDLSLLHLPNSMAIQQGRGPAIPNFLPFLSFLPVDHLSILAIPMVQMLSNQTPAAD